MLNVKKTTIAILLSTNGLVFAGTMGPICTEVNSTVPCKNSAWEFGAQALYLQAGSPALNLLGNNLVAVGTNSYDKITEPYAWGFKVQGGYHFGTGSDVNLNWYNDQYTTGYTSRNQFNFKNNNWNAVNLEIGQKVNYGDNKYIRFHGGASYSRIFVDYRRQGTGLRNDAGTNVPAFQTSSLNSSYNGFGPRLGADMNYTLNHGLGLYANGAAALLVGKESFSNLMTLEGLAPTMNGGSSTVVVPELEAKLGANYTHQMANGQLVVDAGWMWVNYFNAYLYDTSIRSVIGNQETSMNDFSLQGPFVGLKWIGNVA